LLEVLVASCIICIFLGVLLSGFSVSMRNAKNADAYITAVQIARMKFNELANRNELSEEENQGDLTENFQQFKWRSSVKKYEKVKDGFSISVEVSFGGDENGKTFRMNSFALKKRKMEKDSEKNGKLDSST